jgi:hypothetical protein
MLSTATWNEGDVHRYYSRRRLLKSARPTELVFLQIVEEGGFKILIRPVATPNKAPGKRSGAGGATGGSAAKKSRQTAVDKGSPARIKQVLGSDSDDDFILGSGGKKRR